MKKISFLLFALCTSMVAFAQTYNVDKAHAKVGFTVTHLGFNEVDGSFKKFDAKVTASKEDFSDAVFEFSADVKSVSTDNEMRDGHLQKPDMFDSEKFANLTFKSTGISKVSDKNFKLTGDLTMKGVTKSVTLDMKVTGTTTDRGGKKVAGFKVTGNINRADFGVGSKGSMMISEDIELRAIGEFKAG